jgi:hypothetical protein
VAVETTTRLNGRKGMASSRFERASAPGHRNCNLCSSLIHFQCLDFMTVERLGGSGSPGRLMVAARTAGRLKGAGGARSVPSGPRRMRRRGRPVEPDLLDFLAGGQLASPLPLDQGRAPDRGLARAVCRSWIVRGAAGLPPIGVIREHF